VSRARVFFGRGVIVRLAVLVLVIFALLTAFANIVAPYDPNGQLLADSLSPPSLAHPLGQDNLGRDMLSRIIYGGRVSLVVSVLACVVAALIGVTFGLVAGYRAGATGRVIMAATDIMLSIPSLVLSLVLAAILGGGIGSLVLAVGLAMVPTYIRMVNGLVLSLREHDYIIAAKLIGQPERAILLRHLLPNSFPINLGNGVLTESTLSYLGVGVRPPTASWGSMVSDVYPYLLSAPWLVISPGLCIVLIIMSFNLVGDGLRDALDPRLRGKL
jgi:peptide/nickel transport system permease protein